MNCTPFIGGAWLRITYLLLSVALILYVLVYEYKTKKIKQTIMIINFDFTDGRYIDPTA